MNLVIIEGTNWHRYEGRNRLQSVKVDLPDATKLQDVLELLEDFRVGRAEVEPL